MGINVLSLFNGLSGINLALDKLGICPNKIYTSEIDKYCLAVERYNYPQNIQLGDIQNWCKWDLPKIDLLVAGSPCQGFSNAGKGLNFQDPRSKLFFDFVDILNFYKPKYFMLENVVPKKKEWANIISSYVGVAPIFIDSALVSAQSRKRLYWTNIHGVEQPKDKGIVLEDILEKDVDKTYYIDELYYNNGNLKQHITKKKKQIIITQPIQLGYINKNHRGSRVYSTKGKAVTLCASGGGWGMKTGLYIIEDRPICISERGRRFNENGVRDDKKGEVKRRYETNLGYKLNALTTVLKDNYVLEHSIIRMLTPVETERAQTIPDNYTQYGIDENGKKIIISKTQRYKMVGNGWTNDVIVEILSNMEK